MTIAAVAAAVVLAGDGHVGRLYELMGPATIDWDDVATVASELAGREIRYRPITDDEFCKQAMATGFPAAAVDSLLA